MSKPLLSRGLQGCCSRHGGVAYCDSISGNVLCKDGSVSPTCRCDRIDNGNNTRMDLMQPRYQPLRNDDSGYSNYPQNAYTYHPQYANPRSSEEYKKSMWFMLNVKAGYEKYIYYTDTTPEDKAYSELKLYLEPINLAYIELNLSIPFVFFKSIYKYQHAENGMVNEEARNQFIQNSVNNKKMQFFLNIAGGVLGVEGSYSRQDFSVGVMEYYRSEKLPSEETVMTKKNREKLIGMDNYATYKEQADVKYHFCLASLKWEKNRGIIKLVNPPLICGSALYCGQFSFYGQVQF